MVKKPTYQELENRVKALESETADCKHAQEALRESGEIYRLAMDATTDGLWDWKVLSGEVYYSPSWSKILGESDVASEYGSWENRIHPEDQALALLTLQDHLKGKTDSWQKEHRLRTKTGEWKWVLGRGRVVERDATGQPLRMIGTVTDISEHKRTEAALRESKARFQYLVSSSPAVIYTCKAEGNYGGTFISDNITRQLGYQPREFIEDSGFWADRIHPEDAPRVLAGAARVFEYGRLIHEYRFPHKDGSYRWMRDEITLVRDGEGKPVEIIGCWFDITDRKQAEEALQKAYDDLKNVQTQLVQSAKLASIGELAAGVAHELNQPLMVIRGTAQLTLRRQGKNSLDTAALVESLNAIEKNTKRMMNIINHLRTFSRQSKGAFAPVDVNGIIQDSFMMIGEQLKLRNIEVSLDFSNDLPKVLGDPNQLEQILLNLLTNARDAIGFRISDFGMGIRRKMGKLLNIGEK